MPYKPLSGAFEKVNRALAHIKALEDELDTMADLPDRERPYNFVPRTDMQCLRGVEIPRQQALREYPIYWPDSTPIDPRNVVVPVLESELMGIYLQVNQPLPLIHWGVIIGDIAHDLRSALDQLVWELSLHHQRKLGFPHGAPEKTLPYSSGWRHCYFPVCNKDTGWLGHVSDKLRFIGQNLTTIIDNEQPYHFRRRYQRHWLWLLDELWNRDKHRAVAITAMYGLASGVGFTTRAGETMTLDEIRAQYEFERLSIRGGGRFVDGMRLAAIVVRRRDPKPPHQNFNLRVQTRVRVQPVFEKTPPTYGALVIPKMREIATEVTRVLNLFVDKFN
jgi:hypothetical protein